MRIVLGAVILAGIGACGSTVAHRGPVVVGYTADYQPVHAAPVQSEPPYDSDPVVVPPSPAVAPPVATIPPAAPPAKPRRPLLSPPVPPVAEASGKCDWQANLEQATVGRLADWIILDTGAWGRAEVPGIRIWIAPRTPCDKVYSVAVHEWTHHMQGVVYGDWRLVQRELAPYGGPEVVADCGALIQGATWIKYGCTDQRSVDAAFAILHGERPAPPTSGSPW